MSDLAFDIKPERPQRTVIDPFRTAQLVYEGGRLLEAESDEQPKLKPIIWRLIQEAVECDRAIRKPGPAVPSRSGPEIYYSRSEIWATELQWAADNITHPPRFVVEQPSAAAHQRYLDVMTWFRFITSKGKNKALFVRMIIALARGMPPQRAADIFRGLYYRNGNAVWAARYRALDQIAGRLKESCRQIADLD